MFLSGTPVQNDVKELLALLTFLMPQIFQKKDCEILLEAFGLEQAQSRSRTLAETGNGIMNLSQLRSMFAPFVLRRMKVSRF